MTDAEFFSADYSQIELRIMAHLSQDKNMIDAFLSGYDIHAATAAKIYKVDINDVTADMRRKAKTPTSVLSTASPYSDWRNV